MNTLFEWSDDAIYVIDLEGRIQAWNRGAERLLGYSAGEVGGRPASLLTGEARQDETARNLARIRRGERVEAHDTELLARDGHAIPVSISFAPIHDADGRVVAAGVIARDITKRVLAERALADSEARLRRLADNLPDLIYRLRVRPRLQFEYVSAAALTITGYPPEDYYTDADIVRRLVHPDDRHKLERVLASTDPRELRHPVVLRWIRADGREIWVEQHNAPIIDENDAVVGLEGVIREITTTKQTEQELREAREQLELVLASARQGLFELDLRTGMATVSVEFLAMVEQQHSPRDVPLDRLRSWFHHEDAARLMVLLQDLMTGRRDAYELILRARTRSGAMRWIRSVGRVVSHDANGRPARMLGTHMDISALYEAERARQQMEERHWTLFDTMAQGVVYIDANGNIVDANPAAVQILGASLEELKDRRLEDPTWRSLREDGTPLPPEEYPAVIALQHGREVNAIVMGVLNARERRHRWLLVHARPEFAPGERTPSRVYTTFTDITALRETEAALRESEEKYRAIVENSPDIFARFDRQLRYVYVSPSFERYHPGSAAAVLGRRGEEAGIPAGPARKMEELVRAVFEDAQPREGEIVYPGATERDTRTFQVRLYPEFGPDSLVRAVVAVSSDTTARRQLEEQLRHVQRMEAVGRLAGGVAHDFNNLLTGIRGCTRFLLSSLHADDPRRNDALEIDRALDRAESLTRQLLAFSRRQIMQPRVLQLRSVVESLEKMLRRLIGEDIEMVTRVPPDLGLVRADPGQIEQVILNLAINARDAMPRGGRLELKLENAMIDADDARYFDALAPGEYVVLGMTDTGIGIPPSVRPHIFEPFFSTREHGRGSGLGLSTVYGIVKQSGGHITVESEEGVGTTFRVYLPRVQEAEVEASAQRSAPIVRGAETILFVEDDELVRALGVRTLRALGYAVLEAESGTAALERVRQDGTAVDLIVTDVVMPGMSGPELVEQLAGKAGSPPGVIFTSGYTDDVITRRGVAGSGVTFLEKPFSPETLALRVREILDRRRTQPRTEA